MEIVVVYVGVVDTARVQNVMAVTVAMMVVVVVDAAVIVVAVCGMACVYRWEVARVHIYTAFF